MACWLRSAATPTTLQKNWSKVSQWVVMMVGGMVVGWVWKKKKCVALSTMEAEIVATSQTVTEIMGIVELLLKIGVPIQPGSILHVDNQAAIAQIQIEDTSGREKHIDVRYKFIKDEREVLKSQYCESKNMRAHILTKTLLAPRLNELSRLVMLVG